MCVYRVWRGDKKQTKTQFQDANTQKTNTYINTNLWSWQILTVLLKAKVQNKRENVLKNTDSVSVAFWRRCSDLPEQFVVTSKQLKEELQEPSGVDQVLIP